MVGAQIAVAEGLYMVTVYPVEPMQAIVATTVFAWEKHDIAYLQRLFLDCNNHHVVTEGTD